MNDTTDRGKLPAGTLVATEDQPAYLQRPATSRHSPVREGGEGAAVVREPPARLLPRWRIPTDPPPV